jgi:hypothetical protein
MSHAQHPKNSLVENKLSVIPTPEHELVNLLRSPGITPISSLASRYDNSI